MSSLGDAVEDLARAMGWWREDLSSRRGRWSIEINEEPELGGTYTIRPWEIVSGSSRRSTKAWRVSSFEALLVLRCALLGPTRERCPDCAKRSGSYEWRYATSPDERDTAVRNGWTYGGGAWLEGGLAWTLSRSCPACTLVLAEADLDDYPAVSKWTADQHDLGRRVVKFVDWSRSLLGARVRALSDPTGWVIHEHGWAERFLRAMPRECGLPDGEHAPSCWGGHNSELERSHGCSPGDPDARAKLTRLADQLQLQALEGLGGDDLAQHPDLGVWLALWLGQQPCEVCKGITYTEASKGTSCECCAGSGLALASHADAMTEAGHALVEELDRPRVEVIVEGGADEEIAHAIMAGVATVGETRPRAVGSEAAE